MPLTFPAAPAAAATLSKALNARRVELPAGARMLKPIPVYVLAHDQLAAGPDGTALKAWECHVIAGDHVKLTARIVADAAGRARVTALADDPSDDVLHALEAAERAAGETPYSLRLLDAPAAHLSALWLKAERGEDRFVLLAPKQGERFAVLTPAELRARLRPPPARPARAVRAGVTPP